MIVADVFKVYLYPDPLVALYDYNLDEAEDITSGIINVNIVEGTDTYEGPQQQIDTGQFTIVTRNPAMDPKINPNLKYNSAIKFYDERYGEFFRGFVTDVQVEYQRKDDPIITITGTDIFGAMQRVVVSQTVHDEIMALSTGPTWSGLTFTEFIPYMYEFTSKYLDINPDYIGPPGYPLPQGFWFQSVQAFGNLSAGAFGYAPAKYIPQVGESYLEVINKYAQTNLTSFSAKSGFGNPMDFNYIGVLDFPKYDPTYWTPQQDPYLIYTDYDFSSDPVDGRPYETILIDNGYNRVINQLDISNESRNVNAGELESTTESFTRTSDESIEEYAISRASISTIYPEDNPVDASAWANRYSQNIFQMTSFPGQEIQKITFDNARYEDVQNESTYSSYRLNQQIRIKHQIDNNEIIDRIHDIAGITHDISPDKWEMGFTLKPSAKDLVFTNQGSLPTLELNSINADSNFNFTATIGNIESGNVLGALWGLSSTIPSDIYEQWPYTLSGNMYKDGATRTGLTQTWNFDDDGILAPYSFNADGTWAEPLDNRYGGYGAGTWYVYAYVTLSSRFVVLLTKQITVGVPEVQADFGWSQNLTNNFGAVSFVDTSVNNETGEPDSYAWDFGDGNTSNLQNPTHQYNPAPDETEYEVSLTVFTYGEEGEKIYSTHTETVTLVQPTMTANFNYYITDSTVQFINTSTNLGFAEPDAFSWDLGQGGTSTIANPLKTYTGYEGEPISFDVTLTIRNIWEQTASVTKTITVTPAFTTGNLGVDFIRLRPAQGVTYTANTRFTPYIYFFRGLSSDGNANLLYLKSCELVAGQYQTWTSASGAIVSPSTPFQNEVYTQNLTRDPSITPPTNYGLSGVSSISYALGGSPWQTIFYWGNSDTPKYTLEDFTLNVRDLTIGSTAQWQTVYLDVFVTNIGWVEIGFFPIGKGPVGKNNSLGAASITETTKTLVKNKVLPLNRMNFTYAFNNNNYTATFTPRGVAGHYLWTFPGGVTSTAANPTFTFPNRSAGQSVSLQTPSGTISERINVLPVFPYNFRYIRLKQKLHDGTHEWDTPFIANLKAQTETGTYVSPGSLTNPQSIVSKRITQGTSWSSGYTGAPTFDPLNTQNLTNNTGLRFRTTNANNTSEWDVVVDFKETVTGRVHDITLDAAVPYVSGFPFTVASGITYEIFTTPYTGTFASATDPDNIGGGATWTKLGEIKPDGMFVTKLTTHSLIPS